MSPTSEGWPANPARSAMPIQRAPVGDEPVPAEWLELPDLVEQAERLDRLAADFDLVTTLGLAGFEGDAAGETLKVPQHDGLDVYDLPTLDSEDQSRPD
jgi:hypothetical protein